MSVAIAAQLASRRADLEHAVDELTVERKQPAALVPPLIEGIEQARNMTGAHARRRAAPIGKAPVWLSVTDLIADIDSVVGRPIGSRASWTLRRRVRAWSARMLGSASLDEVTTAAEHAAWWVTAGNALFAPVRWLPLRGATCPDCGHDRVVDEDGIISPALLADTTTGAVLCSLDGCGAAWPAEHLHLLAEALAVQTTTETLALDGQG